MTTIPISQELLFDTNEKGNELLLSVNSTIITSSSQNNTKDDNNNDITLDEAGLHRVFVSSEYILLHLDDPSVIESKYKDLWELGQQLKYAPISTSNPTMKNNIYSKAILWMIYHCRASMAYHQKDWETSIDACQSCLSIDLPPTHILQPSESLLLQKISLMQAHTSSILEKCLDLQHRPSSIVSDDTSITTTSSSSGSIMMICSFCSIKKRSMPVCSQCKSQRYCGIKCLKLDKDRHASHCHQR